MLESLLVMNDDTVKLLRTVSLREPPYYNMSGQAIVYGGDIYQLYGRAPSVGTQWILLRYNVSSNTYTTLATPPATLTAFASKAVLVGSKIYYYGGGANTTGAAVNTLHYYDISNNTWTALASGPRARAMHAAHYYNGKIYVVGGSSSVNVPMSGVPQVDEYDIATNTWMTIPTSGDVLAYTHITSLLIGSKLYVIGGYDVDTVVSSFKCLDLETFEWVDVAPDYNWTLETRQGYLTEAKNGFLYIPGVVGKTFSKNVNIYQLLKGRDPVVIDQTSYGPAGMSWCQINECIYGLGGSDDGSSASATKRHVRMDFSNLAI